MKQAAQFVKEVSALYKCQVVVILTYSNTTSLGHLATCEEEFQKLRKLGKKKQAKLCRWTAWREAKMTWLKNELGEAVKICTIDNDELSKTNDNGERILLNGEAWVSQLVDCILEAKVQPGAFFCGFDCCTLFDSVSCLFCSGAGGKSSGRGTDQQ